MIDVGKLSPLWVALLLSRWFRDVYEICSAGAREWASVPHFSTVAASRFCLSFSPEFPPWWTMTWMYQSNKLFPLHQSILSRQKKKKKKKVGNENNVSIVPGTKYRIVQRVRRHLPPLSCFPLTYFPSLPGCALPFLAPDILERLLLVSQWPRFIFVLGSLEQVIPFLSLQLSAHTVRVLILLNHPLTWLTLPSSALGTDFTYFRKPSSCWDPLLLFPLLLGFVSSP